MTIAWPYISATAPMARASRAERSVLRLETRRLYTHRRPWRPHTNTSTPHTSRAGTQPGGYWTWWRWVAGFIRYCILVVTL